MRQSELFLETLKDKPKEKVAVSQEFLTRGGFIAQLAAGIWSLMPLGFKVYKKIEQIIREEMLSIGAQEVLLPTLQPKEIWVESNRWDTIDPPLFKLKDRHDKEYALGPTHEEVISDLARRYIHSYKQLPVALFQIQNKFRNELRATGGLLRVREFMMKDLYSFGKNDQDLNEYYKKVKQAYENIYERCGLKVVAVEASAGTIGGSESNEFMALAESGEDRIVICDKCGYGANVEQAQSILPKIKTDSKALPLEIIDTNEDKTIDDICIRLKIKPEKTLKAVFYSINNKELIFAVIRGDLEINEEKLKKLLDAQTIRLARRDELNFASLLPGQASPIGIKNIKIIADNSIKEGNNFVAGANIPNKHYKNANYPRDFKVDKIYDFRKVKDGDFCVKCKQKIKIYNSIEVGHIFKLGTLYSKKLNINYLSKEGKKELAVMGCYGIGLGRLMATIVETSYDKNGIIWPLSVAPYQAHLLSLGSSEQVYDAAEKIYEKLCQEDIDVLYDDRKDVTAGGKFADSDLLGIPYRLVISEKTKNLVEIKKRGSGESKLIDLEQAIKIIKTFNV